MSKMQAKRINKQPKTGKEQEGKNHTIRPLLPQIHTTLNGEMYPICWGMRGK